MGNFYISDNTIVAVSYPLECMLTALKNTTYLRVNVISNKFILDYTKNAFKILNNCKENNE